MRTIMLLPTLNLPPFLSAADFSPEGLGFAQDVRTRKELVRAAGAMRRGHRRRERNPAMVLRYRLPMMRILS